MPRIDTSMLKASPVYRRTPRPTTPRLDLLSFTPDATKVAMSGIELRRAWRRDLEALAPVFRAAFAAHQPFASLDDATKDRSARECLERTCASGDGPWVRPASFVALAEGKPIAAILITLLPAGDPTAWDTYYWDEPPPLDLLKRRGGQPHLTWIFVSPRHKGRGIGTAAPGPGDERPAPLGLRDLAFDLLQRQRIQHALALAQRLYVAALSGIEAHVRDAPAARWCSRQSSVIAARSAASRFTCVPARPS